MPKANTNTPLPAELIDDLLEGVCASTETLDAEAAVYRRLARLALERLPASDVQALLSTEMDFLEADLDPEEDEVTFTESEAAAEAFIAIRDYTPQA